MVKVLMREIRDLTDEDMFVAKMTVLIENVEHHADEEESEMFPELREDGPGTPRRTRARTRSGQGLSRQPGSGRRSDVDTRPAVLTVIHEHAGGAGTL